MIQIHTCPECGYTTSLPAKDDNQPMHIRCQKCSSEYLSPVFLNGIKKIICPIMGKECLKEGCAWWMEEITIGSLGIPEADELLKKAMGAIGYEDGKIPAMCSIKYRSIK